MNPVRRRVGAVTLLIVTLLAQSSFFPHFRFFGVMPDVLIVAVAAVAAREGAEVGATFGFTAGVLIDLFLEVPLGLSALSYAVVGYGVGTLHTGIMRSTWWIGPLLGGTASIAAGSLFVLVGIILGQDHLLSLRSFTVIPTRAIYDGVVALLVFPLTAQLLGPAEDELSPYEA
ncbi:MAG TPA: rod shape-determining protein MreD [Acidimicrobiia bacterium]|nr:rod shape-determining protein MreD [Acidimicrobiia bacterium]